MVSSADFTAANDTQLTSILTGNNDATLSGKTIELTGPSYGVMSLTSRAFTAPFTIRGPLAGPKPVVQGLTIAGNVSRATFSGLDFYDPAFPYTRAGLVAFTGAGTMSDLSWLGCSFRGNMELDPTADYSAGLPNLNTGFTREGNSWPTNITIDDCVFSNLESGIKFAVSNGFVRYRRNLFDRIYSDPIHVATVSGQLPPIETLLRGNKVSLPVGRATDTGNPHPDIIQLSHGALADWLNIIVEGNFAMVGAARGEAQILMRSSTQYIFEAIVRGNLKLDQLTSLALDIEEAQNCYIFANTMVRDTYADVDNASTASITVGVAKSRGKHFVGANIAEAINLYGAGVDRDNVRLGRGGAAIPYETVFAGTPPSGPTSLADALAKYTPKPAYAGKGAVGWGYVDFATGVVDSTKEPTFVPLTDKIDVGTSTLVTSDVVPFLGGVTGRALSVSAGLEYQITADRAGTSVLVPWTSAPGTSVVPGYIQVRRTSSASSGTALAGTVTVGSEAWTWNVITATQQSFAKVRAAGAGTYALRTGALTGIAESRQGTLMFRGGLGSLATVNYLLRQASLRFYLQALTSGKFRVRGQTNAGTTILQFDTAGAVLGDFSIHTFLASWDLTGGDPANLDVLLDFADSKTLTGLTYTDGLIDYDQATNWQGLYGSTGGNVATDVEAIWFHPQKISFADPVNKTLFYKERIGASGEGPLGFAPLVYLAAAASDWNSGTANKGTGGAFAVTGGSVSDV